MLKEGFNHMLKDFVPCAVSVCRFCSEVRSVCDFPQIVKLLVRRTVPMPFGGDTVQLSQIPWTGGTGDPGLGFCNFVRKFWGVDSNVCFTHFSPIGAKYGHHARISNPKYREGQFRDH